MASILLCVSENVFLFLGVKIRFLFSGKNLRSTTRRVWYWWRTCTNQRATPESARLVGLSRWHDVRMYVCFFYVCTCFFICMLDGSDDKDLLGKFEQWIWTIIITSLLPYLLLLNLKTQQQQTSSAYGRLFLDPGCLYELVKVDEHTSMLAFQFLVSRSRPSCVSRNT